MIKFIIRVSLMVSIVVDAVDLDKKSGLSKKADLY